MKRKSSSLVKRESNDDLENDSELNAPPSVEDPSSRSMIPTVHPLLRPSSFDAGGDDGNDGNDGTKSVGTQSTMNPKYLITGFYGLRGERIRHVVHEGALRLPQDAFDVLALKNSLAQSDCLESITDVPETNPKKKSKTNKKSSKAYELPKLDSLQRPSLNVRGLGSVKVTFVSGEIVQGEGSALTPLIRSVARNKILLKADSSLGRATSSTELQRIRGGGGETPQNDDGAQKATTESLPGGAVPDESNSTNITNVELQQRTQDNSSTRDTISVIADKVEIPSSNVPIGSSIDDANRLPKDQQPLALSKNVESTTAVPKPKDAPTLIGSLPVNPEVASSSTQPVSYGVSNLPLGIVSENSPASTYDNTSQQTAKPLHPSASVSREASVVPQSKLDNLDGGKSNRPLEGSASAVIVPPVTSSGAVQVTSSAQNPPKSSPDDPSGSSQENPPQVLPLKKRPAPQWEQQMPSANDEMQVDVLGKMPKPSWFNVDKASDFEMTVLPEWFDGSAPHRTPDAYVLARNTMMIMSQKLGYNRFVTATMARRSIPGDAGSIIRLHAFLTTFAVINEDAINDTVPTPASFRQPAAGISKLHKIDDPWSNVHLCETLLTAVVHQANNKKHKVEDGSAPVIDWTAVANSVGHGVSPIDCERQFLSMSIERIDDESVDEISPTDRPITPDVPTMENFEHRKGSKDDEDTNSYRNTILREFVRDIVSKSDSSVVQNVTQAALQSADFSDESKRSILSAVSDAQSTGVLGLIVDRVSTDARSEEDSVARLLAEVVELRMQKLENRLSLLDDVEGMLEAERVALELERRDLYTARCRHWFGGT